MKQPYGGLDTKCQKGLFIKLLISHEFKRHNLKKKNAVLVPEKIRKGYSIPVPPRALGYPKVPMKA